MTTGIIEIIKQASLDAMHNQQLCDIRFGTVVSTSPLKVKISNLMTIPSSMLVVPKHLTDYTVEYTMSQPSPPLDNPEESETIVDGESQKSTITIYNALKNGDKVALLRSQGGQPYFILDRI